MIQYGFSVAGSAHIDRKIACQDSSSTDTLKNGWSIVAIADGVGSAKYSDKGSKIAVDTVMKYCKETIIDLIDIEAVPNIIKSAYKSAFKNISQLCEKNGDSIDQYDTTLSMVIYDGEGIVYGHVGDGGIFIQNYDGKYTMVTKPQKGEDGISVIPLRAGEKYWDINIIRENICNVVLVTDGILDIVTPYLMKLQDNNIYIPLLQLFCYNSFANSSCEEYKASIKSFIEGELTKEQFCDFFKTIIGGKIKEQIQREKIETSVLTRCYPLQFINSVTDDKTVAAIINENRYPLNEEYELYMETDWKSLKHQWNVRAYPQMYTK